MENKSKCEVCGAEVTYLPTNDGKGIKCFKCRLKMMSNTSITTKPAESGNTTKPTNTFPVEPANQVKTSLKDLPERMKASKALLGFTCTLCQKSIDLGDDIFNCQSCHTSCMHFNCYENRKTCGNMNCNKRAEIKSQKLETKITLNEPIKEKVYNPSDEMIPCIFCGESIMSKAVKCPYCNQVLKAAISGPPKLGSRFNEDEDLTVGDYIISMLCGFALFMGIIYLIQGKSKGWKVILIAIIAESIKGAIIAYYFPGFYGIKK